MGNLVVPDQNVAQPSVEVTARQPFDYFAEQNRVRVEQQMRRKKNLVRIGMIGGVVLLVMIGLGTWWIIRRANNGTGEVLASGSSEEVVRLREVAEMEFRPTAYQDAAGNYVLDGDIGAAKAVFEQALKDWRNRNYVDQIRLAAMSFYGNSGYYAEVVEMAEQVNVDNLQTDQKVMYYNLASNSYGQLGETEKQEEYFQKAVVLNLLSEEE